MERQKLPLGISDFQELREGGFYYVDKSLFAEEVMEADGKVLLLPRPRRFGKTLNLSMLRYFFDSRGNYSALFNGLAITHTRTWQEHQGKHPVLYLTLKDCKGADWPQMQEKLAESIAPMCVMHEYLLNDSTIWKGDEREQFMAMLHQKARLSTLENSLGLLAELMHRHHGQRVVMLIDEYDSGLMHAYNHGFYEPMRNTLRNLLSKGLKDNQYLAKGIVTGILRVAKESLFSGLNNLAAYTVLQHKFADKFGLTTAEVKQLLHDYNLGEQHANVNKWYNGYSFGNQAIYNPWSIIHYLSQPEEGLMPYWLNTSDNSLVMEQLQHASVDTLEQIQAMVQNRAIEIPLEEHTVFNNLARAEGTTLFSFLVFTGYLKARFSRQEITERYYTVQVPNLEVFSVYQTTFKRFLSQPLSDKRSRDLANALLNADWEVFAELLNQYIMAAFSTFEATKAAHTQPERIYHAFMLGVLAYLHPTHHISSNPNLGLGRADMQLVPRDANDRRAYLLEFKRATSTETLEATAHAALQQIADKQYTATHKAEGRQVIQLGLAFYGKQVAMRFANENSL